MKKKYIKKLKKELIVLKLFNNYSIDIIVDSNSDDDRRKYKVRKLEFHSDVSDEFSNEILSLIKKADCKK